MSAPSFPFRNNAFCVKVASVFEHSGLVVSDGDHSSFLSTTKSIDDFEVAYVEGRGDRAVQVRSSSRVGYLDFGVNAKRINYIAKQLKAKGWDAPGVDPATHQEYVSQNSRT